MIMRLERAEIYQNGFLRVLILALVSRDNIHNILTVRARYLNMKKKTKKLLVRCSLPERAVQYT
jgi:hypothetical protein